MPWSSVMEALGPSTGTTTNSIDQAKGMNSAARLSTTMQESPQGRSLGGLLRRSSLTRAPSASIDILPPLLHAHPYDPEVPVTEKLHETDVPCGLSHGPPWFVR